MLPASSQVSASFPSSRIGTYIEHINSALVHKESLKQSLDKDLPFSQRQDEGIEPCAPALPDGQEGDLRQVSNEEEDQIDNDGDD